VSGGLMILTNTEQNINQKQNTLIISTIPPIKLTQTIVFNETDRAIFIYIFYSLYFKPRERKRKWADEIYVTVPISRNMLQ